MPPPTSRQQRRPRWQLEDDAAAGDDSDDDGSEAPGAGRPCKLQRTQSLSRTKSVPAGLNLQLLSMAEPLEGADERAMSC